jgi:hypothetical protein
VVHRNGTRSHELAPLKKSVYSLHDLRQLAVAANRRYLEFLSALEDPSVAIEAVRRVSENVEHEGRSYRGFNFFSDEDVLLFEIILRGEHTIQGLCNVVFCFASSTHQMNSLRASRMMSFHAASASGLPASAWRRSSGSGCTTAPGTRWSLTAPGYTSACAMRAGLRAP